MTRTFPREGEQATTADGAVYLWIGGAWHWAGRVRSAKERAHTERLERKARLRLHRDLLAWQSARACLNDVPAMIRPSHLREAFAELVLRAALTDAIARVADSLSLGLESHTQAAVDTMLGPRAEQLHVEIARHRLRAAPQVVLARAMQE